MKRMNGPMSLSANHLYSGISNRELACSVGESRNQQRHAHQWAAEAPHLARNPGFNLTGALAVALKPG